MSEPMVRGKPSLREAVKWLEAGGYACPNAVQRACAAAGAGTENRQKRFFANARPEWDLRYFSNSSALYLSGKAQYQTNSQGLNLAVCVDLPALCSGSRRFKSAVAPTYSCSGKLMLRMM
jgi:hypothetical protein